MRGVRLRSTDTKMIEINRMSTRTCGKDVVSNSLCFSRWTG